MVEVIQPQVNCSSAQEFLGALSPLGKYFSEINLEESWMFRGQGRDVPLIPSAFRKEGKFASLTNRDIKNYSERLLAEREILIEFFRIGDKRGLIIPDDSKDFRNLLETFNSERGDRFVPERDYDWNFVDKFPSLTALAQHYGVPTRLLDWTRQPFIAAFFAAESALDPDWENESSGNLAVWAFSFPFLGKHDVISKTNDPIQIITAPSATNPNLKAQQGVFTFLNPHDTNEANNDYPSIDIFLLEEAKNADVDNPCRRDRLIIESRLRKFTLPISEARELLYFLSKLDITPSAIYPGYQSIIEDLRMRSLRS